MFRWLQIKPEKNSPLLGIDIGSDSVKFLELLHINGVYRISACAELPINNIAETFKTLPFQARSAVIAIPDQKVMVKTLLLNTALNEFEIEEHIRLEAEHYFGFSAADIAFDYKLKKLPADKEKQTVLVVAARRNEIAQRLALLKALRLKIIAVDVESHAVVRAMQLQHYKNSVFIYSRESTLFLLTQHGQEIIARQEPLLTNETLVEPISRMLTGLARHAPDIQVTRILVLHNETKLAEFINTPLSIHLKIINPLQEMLIAPGCAEEINNFAHWAISCGLAMWSFHEK